MLGTFGIGTATKNTTPPKIDFKIRSITFVRSIFIIRTRYAWREDIIDVVASIELLKGTIVRIMWIFFGNIFFFNFLDQFYVFFGNRGGAEYRSVSREFLYRCFEC